MHFDLQVPPRQLAQCTEVAELYSTQELAIYFQENFPRGIASHGIEHILNNNFLKDQNGDFLPYTNLSSSIEVIYELVRQLKFPERPSRFECAFAFNDPLRAREFFKNAVLPVYEISGSARIFEGDMTLLKIGPSHIATLCLAEKYWSGKVINPATVEVLIECPAIIGNRVL